MLATEITLFKDRVRVDVQTATPGVLFADAWANRMTVTCQGQDFFILSKADLIRSQCAAGKPADREDVMLLRDDADPPASNRAAVSNHAHDRQQQNVSNGNHDPSPEPGLSPMS